MDDKRKKGHKAEEEFKLWLDYNSIPYIYFHQEVDSFSSALGKHFGGKRPDFMILLPYMGFILVDVKYKKVTNNFADLTADYKDCLQYSSLQRNFNLNVWYAISNEQSDFKTWYWIPVSKIFEVGQRHITENKKEHKKNDYFALKLKDFSQIAFDDSLDRLFSKLFLRDDKQ